MHCFFSCASRRRLLALCYAFGIVCVCLAQTSTDYCGKFSRIFFNSEKEIPNKTICTQITTSKNAISLAVPPFKLGKMPGSIRVEAKNIPLKSDGSFDQIVDNALCVKIGFGSKYKARIQGKWQNNRLSYTVESIDATFLFKKIHAIFGFTNLCAASKTNNGE